MAKSDITRVWTLNYRLIASVIGEVAPALQALGLEVKELFLLAEVDAHPNPAALADALLIPKPSVTVYVKRLESAELLRRNQQEVAAAKGELMAAARKESEDLLQAARKTINEEKRQAIAELRAQTVDLAIDAAKRLVQANMDPQKQKQLVEEYLKELPKESRV